MKNLMLLGTSRLHRPFCKRDSIGNVFDNIRHDINVIFPRVGYFHAAPEILQVLHWMKDSEVISPDLMKYVFRAEPRKTTPKNEFSVDLENSIRKSLTHSLNIDLDSIECLIVEVSSLSFNRHLSSGIILHSNPNFEKNVAYKDIYPEGYYAKFESDMLVNRSTVSELDVVKDLVSLKRFVPNAKIIVMGHLVSEKYPNKVRNDIHNILVKACKQSNCIYANTAPFLDEYGFASVGETVDIHHLSHEGEVEFGKFLQELAFSNV
ncbi:hypothetical protein [Comamonas thiooxydans]|uniref:hypothetical protein n=1 Tax=Comamonas thiooxydans TaxID=363952 RepID=UPI0018E370DA|nr:hypothetical protein [Comamonas thiooxydans]